MHKELLARFPMIDLVLAGELIFFAIFVGSLFWVFRRNSQDFYSHLAAMPLEEGEKRRD